MDVQVTEAQGHLVKSGQVTLDASGGGVLTFDPSSARERWEVESVVVRTDQAANAVTVPVATLAKNTTVPSQLSQANSRGQTWSGNQDIFTGKMNIYAADYLSVIFAPPPGATAGQIAALAGVIAYATVTGTRYTRRA